MYRGWPAATHVYVNGPWLHHAPTITKIDEGKWTLTFDQSPFEWAKRAGLEPSKAEGE